MLDDILRDHGFDDLFDDYEEVSSQENKCQKLSDISELTEEQKKIALNIFSDDVKSTIAADLSNMSEAQLQLLMSISNTILDAQNLTHLLPK